MARHKGASTKKDTHDTINNASKTLLANIRFMSVDKNIKTVAITSAIPNEGKTFIASSLAWAMATSGKRTLVVECDMRRRSLSKQLGAHAQKGLYAVMAGEARLEDAVIETKTKNLYFLDAEPHIPNPSDLLNSYRFAQLIEALENTYEYVVFDTPPVGTFVDAAVLGSRVDAVFMVVRERYTRRDEVARAAEQLRTANAPLSGVVMNFCERQSNEYYYEYYYREGSRRRSRRRSSGEAGESFLATMTSFEPDDAHVGLGPQGRPASWDNAPDMRLLEETGPFEVPTADTAAGHRAQRFRPASASDTNTLPRGRIAAALRAYGNSDDQAAQ